MYTILPHTADVRLFVCGLNQEGLFRSAMQGMSQIQRRDFCTDAQGGPLNISEKLEIRSTDLTTLLIDFLSGVLTLSHIHKAIFCEVHFITISGTALTATIEGLHVDEYDEDIKAVTYHEAEVILNLHQQLETIIVFDI